MHYSLKARCQGCIALTTHSDEFKCGFGIPLLTEEISGMQSKPTPNETKCYKPTTKQELVEAKKLMAAKEKVF